MFSKKKADSYQLYICTHLSRAKINLKVDKSHSRNQKRVTYVSKPNPSLTIKANGQTTIYTPPSSSLIESNEFEKAFIEYDPFQTDTPSIEMDEPQTFSFETSEFHHVDFNHEAHPSRYKPNILKNKNAKVQICESKTSKANNKKDLVQEKSRHKRKQTYDLSNIDEVDLVLHEPNKRIKLKTKDNCRKRVQKKPKSPEKEKEEVSFVRISPIVQGSAFQSLMKKCEESLLCPEIFRESSSDRETSPDRETSLYAEESPDGDTVPKEESFPDKETFPDDERSPDGESSVEAIINSEFFIPNYSDYLSTCDSISHSDEVHKLISPWSNGDIFDMPLSPPLDPEPMQDISYNDLNSISSLADLDDPCKSFILEHNSLKGYMESINFQNDLDFKESDSIRSKNLAKTPVYIPHFGAKDSLINGCNIFSDEDSQGYQSNRLEINPVSDESKDRKPQVIVGLNKYLLSCGGHVECYNEKDTERICDPHQYLNNPVPVSPKNLPDSPKTLTPIEEPNEEEILVDCLDNETNLLQNKEEAKPEMYYCPDCDIAFVRKRSLAIHRNRAHSGFYTYTCKRCATLCNSKYHLQRHTQGCASKKTLACLVCSKRYSYKSSLKQHLKNKHGVSEA